MVSPAVAQVVREQKKKAIEHGNKYVTMSRNAASDGICGLVYGAGQLDAEINAKLYGSLSPEEQKEYAKYRVQLLEWKANTWRQRL